MNHSSSIGCKLKGYILLGGAVGVINSYNYRILTSISWDIAPIIVVLQVSKNGGTVPYKAIFYGDISLPRPYIGLIYGKYLQFRYPKWPLSYITYQYGYCYHMGIKRGWQLKVTHV